MAWHRAMATSQGTSRVKVEPKAACVLPMHARRPLHVVGDVGDGGEGQRAGARKSCIALASASFPADSKGMEAQARERHKHLLKARLALVQGRAAIAHDLK